MDNKPHKPEKNEGDKKLLPPLHSFFILLKTNGFSVTPQQVTDSLIIIDRYASVVKNQSELCDYLSPLFAQNEEEQKQFKELFDDHFKEKEILVQPPEEGLFVKHIRRHKWKYGAGIVLILIVIPIVINILKTPGLPYRPSIVLINSDDGVVINNRNSFISTPGKKLAIYPRADSVLPRHKKKLELRTRYDWGDLSALDTASSHIYKNEGQFLVKGYVDVLYKNQFQYTDTATATVTICGRRGDIDIKASVWVANEKSYRPIPLDSIPIGEKVKFEPFPDGDKPDSIYWSKPDETTHHGNTFETSFDRKGPTSIDIEAIYDSINSPCTQEESFNLFVYDPNEASVSTVFSQQPNANPVVPKEQVKSSWALFMAIVFVLSSLLYMWFKSLSEKTKKKTIELTVLLKDKLKGLLSSFKGKKPPYELPFQNKNYLAVPEAEINEFARQTRRRISDESLYLDVQKTIHKSIKSAGMYQPVSAPRTQQSEYLVLIDESQKNNQQVKLFEYLCDILKKQNVHIEKYYYRDVLDVCYSVNEPAGISLEKLSEKYYRHVLFIFGNAYQLLLPHYPLFNSEYGPVLNKWRYKAVLTPVAYADWDNRELQTLPPFIPVFPIDNEGLLLLMQTIFNEEKENIHGLLSGQRNQFYKINHIDFENVAQLKIYCDEADWAIVTENGKTVNILFQWIAALAVYPKIRWEITLAIGKAILDKYDKPRELNYATLLRIVRIKWMQQGNFPDYTRLDLLKELDRENEVIARETILALLKEIPHEEVNSVHFAYEEKEMQRIINEYILYSYNPAQYAPYESSRALFEELWREKKIRDSPARVYLSNKEGTWDTLVDGNISPVGELETTINTPLSKIYRWAAAASLIIFTISSLGLVTLASMQFLGKPVIKNFLYTVDQQREIRFTYINETRDPSYDDVRLNVGDTTMQILSNTTDTISMIPSDSAKIVTLSVGEEILFDTSMIINRDAYIIRLAGETPATNPTTSVKLLLTNKCMDFIQEFRYLIRSADTNLVIITESVVPGPAISRNNCVNSILFGKNVSRNAVDNIIKSFEENKIPLQINDTSSYPVSDNEIIIRYEDIQTPAEKPIIYIHYNTSISQAPARKLQECLNSGIFSSPGIQYQTNFTRNEIRYYNDSFRDSISALQSCLRSAFPNKIFYPVKIPARQSRARAEIWVYDSVSPVIPGKAAYDEALRHYNARNYNAAIPDFQEAINNKYLEIPANRYLGLSYAAINQSSTACKYLKIAADQGDNEASNYYKKYGCDKPVNTADQILNNLELHARMDPVNTDTLRIVIVRTYTYYLKGDSKSLDEIYDVRYGLFPNSSNDRSSGFGLKVSQRIADQKNMDITILLNNKESATKTMNIIFDPVVKGPNATEIANNVKLNISQVVEKASIVNVFCSLTGDARYLDNISEVRYAMVASALDKLDEKKKFNISTNRLSGFSYRFRATRARMVFYFVIVAKDKSISKEIRQVVDIDGKADTPLKQ